MSERGESWSEADSETFLAFGDAFVPERASQIATIVAAIPPPPEGAVLVDLCCGEGLLSEALLERFPGARVIALDGSPAMLSAVERRLSRFADRLVTRRIELAAADWRRFEPPPHAVVSSLAIHHLPGPGKARLFADLARALAPGGALVVADLVAPLTAEARVLAAAQWDRAVAPQIAAMPRPDEARAAYEAEHWNFYRDPEPDPVDQPSPLISQLDWLRAAGLSAVEVYWLVAGHAIFGGRKPG